MPQLDFTIWLINLTTCWLMFFLVFSTTRNLTHTENLNENKTNTINIPNNNWPW
nr:ATPase subuint 8 [Ophiocten ludwigi]